MLPFKLIYSNGYYLPIGAHVFPAKKYRLVHDRLLAERIRRRNHPRFALERDGRAVARHLNRFIGRLDLRGSPLLHLPERIDRLDLGQHGEIV